ncbi:hypothetical protein [Silvibacterium sp.]|uniref:hypothetical protein n=1 Tax=Silvibacterium sp. TaxID=1964179 RepID=UPI0039E40398
MKIRSWKWIAGIVALALVSSLAPVAMAQCGLLDKPIRPSSWHPAYGAASPHIVAAAFHGYDEHEPSIVGMWHVIFTAQTQNGQPVPVTGGVVIDNSVVVWHDDGTEIMNSSRSAQDGNFCLGVWKRTGYRSYYLNHLPWQGNVYDPTAPAETVGAPQAGGQITEKITLSADGNSYTGTFVLKAYDTSGNVYASFTGTLSAKRITPDTPFSDLL